MSPVRACTVCGALSKTSRCPDHQRRPYPHTQSAAARGYDAQWRKARARLLQRHPTCTICGEPATSVDHIVPLSQGGARLHPHNLQPLCDHHHHEKTINDTRRLHR